MSNERVSIFISHKVIAHKRAAKKINDILEARAERLEVHICEEILAGDEFRRWIDSHIAESNMMLVLFPPPPAEMTWIASEITKFRDACPQGRLIAVKRPGEPLPDIIAGLQAIDTDQLAQGFLKPLFFDTSFTGIATALNPRISEADLARDAEQIKDALAGIVDADSTLYAEPLIIDVPNISLSNPEELRTASVRAPAGCRRILNWDRRCFLWQDLRKLAEEEVGKGTFWVTEMEDVMVQVARQKHPSVMSSTFRGRGDYTGHIFQPHLNQVEFVEGKPVRFHFDFHEVLTPELVRGADAIGDVFSLLYLATRVRWEVLNPFLVQRMLEKGYQETQDLPFAKVINSLRVIDAEDERHQIIQKGIKAFEGPEADRISELFDQRQSIKRSLKVAANKCNFDELVKELKRALQLNCEVTEVLASKYLARSSTSNRRAEIAWIP